VGGGAKNRGMGHTLEEEKDGVGRDGWWSRKKAMKKGGGDPVLTWTFADRRSKFPPKITRRTNGVR